MAVYPEPRCTDSCERMRGLAVNQPLQPRVMARSWRHAAAARTSRSAAVGTAYARRSVAPLLVTRLVCSIGAWHGCAERSRQPSTMYSRAVLAKNSQHPAADVGICGSRSGSGRSGYGACLADRYCHLLQQRRAVLSGNDSRQPASLVDTPGGSKNIMIEVMDQF